MDVLGIVQDLAARGVGVEFIDAPTLSATTSQGEFMLIILAAAAQLERSMIVKSRGSSWPRCVASMRRGPSSRSSRSRRFVADGVVPKAVVARDLETDPEGYSGGDDAGTGGAEGGRRRSPRDRRPLFYYAPSPSTTPLFLVQ